MKAPTNRDVNAALDALGKIDAVKWKHMRTVMRIAILHQTFKVHLVILKDLEDKLKSEHKINGEADPKKHKKYMEAWGKMMDVSADMEFKAIPEEWLDEFSPVGDSPAPVAMAALLPFIELSENA